MHLSRTLTITAATAFVVALSYGCTTTTIEVSDAGPDAASPPDASVDRKPPPIDSAPDTSDAPMCTPVDVSSFTPPAYVPAAMKKGACTAQNITDFDADCINASTASSSKCSTFQKATATCVACLQTPDTAAAWGPLIAHTAQNTISVNLGGCIELAGNKTCATSYEADRACAGAACDAVCPVVPNDMNVSIDALNACYTAADSGGCKQYSDAVKACIDDDGGPITTECFSGGNDFDATFIAVAQVFCGP